MLTDYELFELVAGKGIQFLDLSFDIVPVKEGYALRCIESHPNSTGTVVLFDIFQTDAELVAALRAELDVAMWSHITGRHMRADESWGRYG